MRVVSHIVNDQPVDTAVKVVDEETVDAEQPTADVPDDVQGDSRVEEVEANDDEEDDEDEVIEVSGVEKKNRWMLHNYIIPLKGLLPVVRISSFTETLLDFVHTSSQQLFSRARNSRLRIIKYRLRSTMCDEWMKLLMVLASEKDILCTLTNDEIIDNYAVLSDRLQHFL